MFEGRIYKQAGFGFRTIRFADEDGGVATTTYSYKLTDEEREEMARRITAALNMTRDLSTEQIEQAARATPADHSVPVAWAYNCGGQVHLHTKKLDHYYSMDFGETYVKGTPLYAAPVVHVSPIYQILDPTEGTWTDCDKKAHDSTDGAFARIVYTAPQPEAQSVRDE